MPSLFVLIFVLSMLACGDGDRRPENQSSNPLYPSGPEQVQRGQIVTVEGASVSEAEVVIIDAERLVVLARAPVDDQGGFAVSVPQRPSYWLGVSGPYMTTYIDTAFAFTGEAITVGEAPRSDAAGKAAQVVGILGDVNNDNQVDIADALLVLLYTLERFSFVAPNQGNIALGDVNEDDQIDIADVLLIMTYIANPLDPTLPDGIGLATEQTTVAIAVEQDRAVLIALYEATDGDNWYHNTNWLVSTYPLDQWDGVDTDDEGRVTSLDLSSNNLTRPIPEALGQLNNLQALDLRYNDLAGEIPQALGQLNNLQVLDLGYNDLTGPIPETLGQLNSLQALDLSGNDLTGTIPEALGQLDNLKTLNLSDNDLTGIIPEALGQLHNLQYLDLRYNDLTETIPEALGQLDNLKTLNLSDNDLTGCIPETLQDIPNNDLNYFGLAFCSEIASDRSALVAFYEATSGNNWEDNTNWLSTLPLEQWYGVDTNYKGRVFGISLASNDLTGTIPEALGQLNNLETLNLSSNNLTGPIPETLEQLNNLQALDLSSNDLTGTIPEALGQLNNLEILNLSNNDLTGSIPETLGQLNNLQALDLSSNDLTGTVPEMLGQLNNLQALYLAGNELTGCTPPALQPIPNHDLYNLELTFCVEVGNDLSVLIAFYEATGGDNWKNNTNWLSSLPLDQWYGIDTDDGGRVTSLNLSDNGLTGTISEALGQLNNLETLNLSDNELTGPIPKALELLDNLQFLRLRGNDLTGCVPSALRDVPNNDLPALRLSSCQ